MKIGIVSRFGEQDGISIYSDNLVSAIRRQGTECITIGGTESKADYKINLKSIRLKGHIAKIVETEKLGLVHFQYIAARSYYGISSLNMNFVIALSQKVPTAVTLHEVHYNSEDLREKIIKKIEEIIIKKANKIIVHTEGHRKFILEKYKKNAEVAYMGVTLHDMHKRKNNSLLLFGIISPNKGAEYLIEAMQELPEYELTIAGSAVDKEYYKKLIELVGKSKAKIKMETGWISEQRKKELFTNCDMLVLPYIKAPYQSAVLHDAISYGLPIVATRTGGVYEIVEQFKCGEVAEPKSKESLAAAIKKTSSEYEKYQKGIAGYREEANWDRVAARHIEVYRKLTKMCLNHAA